MRRPWSVLVAIAASLAFTACGERAVTSSVEAGGAGDTSRVAPSTVNLSGRVLAVQATPAAMGSDTLRSIPIGGVTLKLMHNVLVNGAATQILAGTAVSAADGGYRFDGLPSGYYVLYAYPSAASGYAGAYSLVPAQAATVVVDVYVWKAE